MIAKLLGKSHNNILIKGRNALSPPNNVKHANDFTHNGRKKPLVWSRSKFCFNHPFKLVKFKDRFLMSKHIQTNAWDLNKEMVSIDDEESFLNITTKLNKHI